MRKYAAPGLTVLLLLASCGGGGGNLAPPPPPPPGQKIAGPGPNVATIAVDGGPVGIPNTAFVSVTLCQPGSTTVCATINGIEVDTGSSGFRVLAQALQGTPLAPEAALPQQVAGTVPVVECLQFADGFSWGPVKSADLTISSETASNIPIQVIGDTAFLPPNATIPSDCSSGLTEEDTVTNFGANGILGVGFLIGDCPGCTTAPPLPGAYYLCPSNGAACTNTTEPANFQVSNPVASFTASGDDNGVIVELPGVTDGTATATGALVFGIGTQGNNGLGSATVLTFDTSGFIDVKLNGTDYSQSFFDSGSNGNYFDDTALTACSSSTGLQVFYCSPANNLMATLTGANAMQLTDTFNVGDAQSLFTAYPNSFAFPSLAGPAPSAFTTSTFDGGLPSFYGRNVFTAIVGRNTQGGTGPYFAY